MSLDELTRTLHKRSDKPKPDSSLAVVELETGAIHDAAPVYNPNTTKIASGFHLPLALRNVLVNLFRDSVDVSLFKRSRLFIKNLKVASDMR